MDPRFSRPADAAGQRAYWRGLERRRPDAIPQPAPGQESVWDYPRPPRLERLERTVEVRFGDRLIARSRQPFRICETAGPPVYYLPPGEIEAGVLVHSDRESFCEWKGMARYWDLVAGGRVANAGWSYPEPDAGFEPLRDAVAFYPGKLECYVDGELVRPQPGAFYGGWVTDEILGPFKGEPGSEGW